MGLPAEIPFNELYRGEGADDAVLRIGNTLQSSGLDAVPELYDEALSLARDGHLGRARDTLQMLLCLDPDDGPAHLLLAKVYASQRRWALACTSVDAAAACGQRLPLGMKDAFESARAEQTKAPEPRKAARRDGEVHALREEARRLRSEHMHIKRVADAYQARSQLLTVGSAVLGGVCVILLGIVLFGGSETEAVAGASANDALAAETLQAEPTFVEPEPFEELVAEPLGEDVLVVGEVVARPVKVAPPVVEAVTPEPIVTPATGQASIWKIESGDTLWTIAKEHYGDATRWQDIAAANDLPEHAGLSLGQTLLLPE